MTGPQFAVFNRVRLKVLRNAVEKLDAAIPISVNHELTEEELTTLNQILPDLPKKGKPLTRAQAMQNLGVRLNVIKVTALSLGITLPENNNDAISEQELESLLLLADLTRLNRIEPQLIGIIDTIDTARDYGIIVTNSLGFTRYENKPLRTIYFSLNNTLHDDGLSEGDWVQFVLSDIKGKPEEIRRISFDKRGLIVCLKYLGELAEIRGKRLGKEYDSNIPVAIIDEIRRSNPAKSKEIVIEALGEFLASIDNKLKVYVYPILLQNKPLLLRLSALRKEMNDFTSEIAEAERSIRKLSIKVREAVIKAQNIDLFLALPRNFDLSDKVSEVIERLQTALENGDAEKVESWLKRQSWFFPAYASHKGYVSSDLRWYVEEALLTD